MCKEKTLSIFNKIQNQIPLFEGRIRPMKKDLLIQLQRSFTDLSRYKDIKQEQQYQFNTQNFTIQELGRFTVNEDANVLYESHNEDLTFKVIKDEKDVWFEIFNSQGFQFSKKVSDKIKNIYQDTVFGTPQWNQQKDKLVFVAEPIDQTFISYYDKKQENDKDQLDKLEKDNLEKDKKKKKEQSEKFLYQENFGETLSKKQNPQMFVFDLQQKELQQIVDQNKLIPLNPIWDEKGNGIILSLLDLPIKQLGLNFCLNHPTKLAYIPDFKKQDIEIISQDFLAIHPKFSFDFQKLMYISSEKFISHSGNYELKYIDWKDKSTHTIVEKFKNYPNENDQFAGLYGYNFDYQNIGFISNRYFLIKSVFKAQDRIYMVDTQTKDIKYLDFLNKKNDGNYQFIYQYKEYILFQYSAFNQPSQVYFVHFDKDAENLENVIQNIHQIDQVQLDQEFDTNLQQFKKETITLENGSEGILYLPNQKEKFPLIVLIHGGPFSHYPQDIFSKIHLLLLLQNTAILIVNYRGSLGYGENFLNSLLGNIGEYDVQDVGELTKKASQNENIDENRIGVEGGSHGGFLSAWLIGHPQYRDLYKAGCLWNPVLNMSYMIQSTDIPDWIFSCTQNKDCSYSYNENDNTEFFKRSPFSVVNNVQCPTLLLIGAQDLRVPPQQSYYYYNCLKKNKVETKLYQYPESGHALQQKEHMIDAYINISLWMDKYL